MSFTLLALLILWLVLPLAAGPSMRRIGLPVLIAALTLTAMVMAGLILGLVHEVGSSPAFSAIVGKDVSAPILRPLELMLSLTAAGGLALMAAGLGAGRKGQMASVMAALGLGLCHAGAFAAIVMAATPLHDLAIAPDVARASTLALGLGAVVILGAFLLGLLRGLRQG